MVYPAKLNYNVSLVYPARPYKWVVQQGLLTSCPAKVCPAKLKYQQCVQQGIIKGVSNFAFIKLMKGKAPWKHSLHEKTAASVLLKLFISGNE